MLFLPYARFPISKRADYYSSQNYLSYITCTGALLPIIYMYRTHILIVIGTYSKILCIASILLNMFGIHFADPTRETVGQRRLRKGSKGNELSRASSLRSSRSSDSAQRDVKQSLLNLFGGGHDDRNALAQPGSHSKLSVLRAGEAGKSSRRVSSYTVVSDSPIRNFTGPGKRRNSGTDNVTSTAIEPDADCSGRSEGMKYTLHGRKALKSSSCGIYFLWVDKTLFYDRHFLGVYTELSNKQKRLQSGTRLDLSHFEINRTVYLTTK